VINKILTLLISAAIILAPLQEMADPVKKNYKNSTSITVTSDMVGKYLNFEAKSWGPGLFLCKKVRILLDGKRVPKSQVNLNCRKRGLNIAPVATPDFVDKTLIIKYTVRGWLNFCADWGFIPDCSMYTTPGTSTCGDD